MIVTNRDGEWCCPNCGECMPESVYVYDGEVVACQKCVAPIGYGESDHCGEAGDLIKVGDYNLLPSQVKQISDANAFAIGYIVTDLEYNEMR